MLFSLVIPVYNVREYLRECLDSVSAQTCMDWECICVDDGSTDDSGKILDEYAARDCRFRVVHKANGGVSAARNDALGLVRGEWIWFVDGDDVVNPASLAAIVRVLEVQSDIDAFAVEKYIRGSECPQWNEFVLDGGRVTEQHSVGQYQAFHWGCCNVVFRANLLRGLQFEDYVVGEDLIFFGEIFWRTKKMLIQDVPLYFYRIRKGSASHGPVRLRDVKDNIEVELRCLAQLRERWTEAETAFWLKKNWRYYLEMNADKFKRLCDEDLKFVLRSWMRLQKLTIALGARTTGLRQGLIVLGFMPSARVARMILAAIEHIGCRTWFQFVADIPSAIVRRFLIVFGFANKVREFGQ